MLKKIALTGIFIFASAFSLSTATAVTCPNGSCRLLLN